MTGSANSPEPIQASNVAETEEAQLPRGKDESRGRIPIGPAATKGRKKVGVSIPGRTTYPRSRIDTVSDEPEGKPATFRPFRRASGHTETRNGRDMRNALRPLLRARRGLVKANHSQSGAESEKSNMHQYTPAPSPIQLVFLHLDLIWSFKKKRVLAK